MKSPTGTTGFIDRSILVGVVRPVTRSANTVAAAEDEPLWRACDLDELLKRIRLAQSPDGDWHAMAADPMQAAELVGRAERRLGSG